MATWLLIVTTATLVAGLHSSQVKRKAEFTVTTNQGESVQIDFAKYNKDLKIANKVYISQKPRHGVCSSETSGIELEGNLCSVLTTYLPNADYSGEDTLNFFHLHENMTTTTEEKVVRVIIRPKPGDVKAVTHYATMTTDDDHVRIDVLDNDVTKDNVDVCITRYASANEDNSQARFENVAKKLGMTSNQALPPKAPDCLFDQYDPKLKLWIKGSFCLSELFSGSAALADYDGDGLMDIYYARIDGPDELWKNMGDGTYRLATKEAGLQCTSHHRSTAVAWADIDEDGDQDLFIGTIAEKRFYLYINNGMGSFTEEAELRGVALEPTIPPFQTSTMSIVIGDYDKDGWLDFYTTEWLPHLDQSFDYNNASHSNCKLLRNLGAEGKPGYFEDVTEKAGLHRTIEPTVDADKIEGGVDARYYGIFNTGLFKDILPGPFKLTAMFTDLDNDGYSDLVVNGDFRTSAIYWNNGDGTFTEDTKSAGIGTDENGMGSTIADYDFDGLQDWFLTSIHITKEQMMPFYEVYLRGGFLFGYTGNRLFKNKGSRKFTDETDSAGVRIGQWGWGAAFFDFDNDGDLDLVHTNGFTDPENTDADFLHGTRSRLFENKYFDDNNGTVHFEETGETRGITDKQDGRGLFVFDYEEDGDLDVFIVNNADRPILYRNIGGNKNDFIRVNVIEAISGRPSIGARVYLYSPRMGKEVLREIRSISSFAGLGENTAHFGLGSETASTFTMRVHWPVTNNTRIIENVSRRSMLTVRDIAGRRNALEVTSSPDKSISECRRTLVTDIKRSPKHGHVTFGPRHVLYYPHAEFHGNDSLTYMIGDGITSSVAEVKIKVEKSFKEAKSEHDFSMLKYSPIDGVGNSLMDPHLGKPMMPLLRLLPPAYSDGFDEPAGINRPGPREVSNALFDQRLEIPSKEGLNDFHMHFGQLVAHDLDFATPYANFMTEDNFGIPIPKGDSWFDPYGLGNEIMRFRRSAKLQTTGKVHGVPREQVNKITGFLDLSVVYGSQKERTDILRTKKNGKLLHQGGEIVPPNTKQAPNLNLLHGPRDKMLVSGDNRVNVQPGLITLHTVFSREHNLICDELVEHYGQDAMDDETLFEYARTITRAKWQKIVWNEFLPTVIGTKEFEKLGSYHAYNASIKFGIFNEFSTAAFRFGHSQIGNLMLRLDENWKMTKHGHLPLRDAYFNPGRIVHEGGIEPLIRGMLKQYAQNVDTLFTDAVRNFLFGTNTKGLDLAAIGIQRGRDHGLPDYNTVRQAIGLSKRTSFEQISSDQDIQEKFKVYGSIDDVDLWVGGLAEDHVEGGCVGETFARIVAEQFRVLRDGDRFWYENPKTSLYNFKDRASLPTKGWTMNEVLERTTGIKWKDSTFHVTSGVQMNKHTEL